VGDTVVPSLRFPPWRRTLSGKQFLRLDAKRVSCARATWNDKAMRHFHKSRSSYTRINACAHVYVEPEGKSDSRGQRGRTNIWRNSKIPSISPFVSVRRAIFDVLYHGDTPPAGRKAMLISCGAFITRPRPGMFYFHEVLRSVNTSDKRKEEGNPPRGLAGRCDPITRPGIRWSSDRWLLPMHNQPLKQTLFPLPNPLTPPPRRWKGSGSAGR